MSLAPPYLQYRAWLLALFFLASIVGFSAVASVLHARYRDLDLAAFQSLQFYAVTSAFSWILALIVAAWLFLLGDPVLPMHPQPLLATDQPFGAAADVVGWLVLSVFWFATAIDVTARNVSCYGLWQGTAVCGVIQTGSAFGFVSWLVCLLIAAFKAWEFYSNNLLAGLQDVFGRLARPASPSPA